MISEFKTTTNRRVYKHDRIDKLHISSCPICGPHKGCNRDRNPSSSWKDQTKKKKQWSS